MRDLETVEDVRRRVCGDKFRHPSPGPARAHARQLNDRDGVEHVYGIYPCPFSDPGDRHWHAGHAPAMETLTALARVMRGLDPTPPVPHDPPARVRRRRRRKELRS